MKRSWFALNLLRLSRLSRRGRLAVAAGLVGAVLAAWVAWLGWPVPGRVTNRMTPLASAESGEWIQVEADLLTRSARITGASGLAVNLRVLRPADAADGSLPVFVLLGGHRTGRDAVDLVGHPGQLIIVALDYPYDGPERLRGVRQVVSTLPQIRRALLDTPASVTLALDWILAQPWADPERIELVGVSLGTQFAAAAGANDDRFRRVWLVQGAGDSRRWLAHQLEDRVSIAPLREAAATLLWWIAHGASLDPARWVAQIAPRPIVVTGARQDASLPKALVTGLHEAAGPASRLIWTEGGHISPRRPATVRAVLDLILPEVD